MSVVIETTLGDITVDLFLQQRPVTCLNFLKLCKKKYYNFNLFHSIRSGFIAQTGDPTGEGSGGESIFGILEGPEKRFFSGEKLPKIRHTNTGTLSMVCTGENMVGSQFFFTLAPDLDSLDGIHVVIGEVTEGHDVLRKLNDVICDEKHRPYRDVRITHTVILEDPYNDPPSFRASSRSPSPSAERLKGGRIAPDEDIDETQGKSAEEIQEIIEDKEAKARATILEIVGDLPDADIAPPENVLFVCKLNPVTADEDLEIIFSRFGKIVSCEVIRDKKTGDSLQYAFIEFSDKKSCEDAYFKMDNVLIDDRRIHVDFSQSVSRMKWLGKGRGVQYFNEDGSSERPERDGKHSKDKRKHRDIDRDHKNGSLNKHSRHEHNKESHREETHRHDRRHREENDRHQRDHSRSRTRKDGSKGIRSRKERSESGSPDTSRKHRNDDDKKHRRSNSRENSSRHNDKSTSRSKKNELSVEDRHRYSSYSKKERKPDSAEYSKNRERSRSNSRDEAHKKHRENIERKSNSEVTINKQRDSEKQRYENPITGRNSKHRDKSRSRSKDRTSGHDHQNQECIKPRDRTVSENSSISISDLSKERQTEKSFEKEHDDREKKHESCERKHEGRERQRENREREHKNRERQHERELEDNKRKHGDRQRQRGNHERKHEDPKGLRGHHDRKHEDPERESQNRDRMHEIRERQRGNHERKHEDPEREGQNRERIHEIREVEHWDPDREHKDRLETHKRKHESRERNHDSHERKTESRKRERIRETPVIDRNIKTRERSRSHSIGGGNNNVGYRESRERPKMHDVTSKSKYRQEENSRFESPDVKTLYRKTLRDKSPSMDRMRNRVSRDPSRVESRESLDRNHGNHVNEQDTSRKRESSNHSKIDKSESRKLTKNRGDSEGEQRADKPTKTNKIEDEKRTKTDEFSKKSKVEKQLGKKKNKESNIKKKKVVKTKPDKKIVKKKRKASTSSSDSSSDTDSSSSSSSSSDDNRRKKVVKRRKKKVSTSSSSSSSSSSTSSSSESSSSTSSSSDSEPSKKKRKKITSSKIKIKKSK